AASPLGRRVLTLRAGLGGRSPRSRERVAHRLGLSKKRVARIEHRSLRRLRSANAASGCGSGASAPRPAAAGPTAPAAGAGGSSLLAPVGGLKGNPVTHGAVLGASASSPPEPHSSVPTKLRSAGARLASTP